MAKYSLLRNAPITEALINIRIKTREDFDTECLASLYNAISNQYPQKKTCHKLEGRFESKKGEEPRSYGTTAVDGYIFTSADNKQIFQARNDGFTFNRLRPYEKWETIRDEALRLWKLYRDLTTPEIFRVALRYINKINIPLFPEPMKDFKEYFTSAPIIPEGLPQGVSSFLTRVVINHPQMDVVAIITQVFEQIFDPKFIPIILDIDVFKQKELISEEDTWQILEELRNFKNEIFFASITEKSKELFQ